MLISHCDGHNFGKGYEGVGVGRHCLTAKVDTEYEKSSNVGFDIFGCSRRKTKLLRSDGCIKERFELLKFRT